MILGNIKNASQYAKVYKGFDKAFEYLAGLKEFPEPGKYAIDGENVFASVQVYDTAPAEQNKWESHRKYIDIQYLYSGNEKMGWAGLDGFPKTARYDKSTDCILEEKAEGGIFFDMTSSQFAVFFPTDVHKPRCIANKKPENIKKIVMKVIV